MPTKPAKQLLNLKFIFLLGLVTLGPYVLAQASDQTSEESSKNKTVIEPSSQVNPQAEIQEDHDTKNLSKLLKDYNKEQQRALKDAEKIPSQDSNDTGELTEKELGTGKVLDPDDESSLEGKNRVGTLDLKHLKKDELPIDLKRTKYSEAIRVALAPLQKMPEAELVKMLKENTKGSAAREYIDNLPTLTIFTVRLIKDSEAIPSIAKFI
jgi:hypothetical protein